MSHISFHSFKKTIELHTPSQIASDLVLNTGDHSEPTIIITKNDFIR